MGIKQFHLVCTFIIWYLFLLWSECSEKSLGTVVILSLVRISYLYYRFLAWNSWYLTKLNKMGIEQFHLVCTFIIWCLFFSLIKCSETSLGAVVILPLIVISQLQLTFSDLKQYMTKLDKMGIKHFNLVHIHNLMFVFILEWTFWK